MHSPGASPRRTTRHKGLMGRMKAVVLERFGEPEVLQYRDMPDPVPEAGEVVIQVRACSVNRGLDLGLRETGLGFGISLPHTPGADPAGVVTRVGATVTSVRVGDRVAVSPLIACGRCRLCARGEDNACLSQRVFGVHCWGGDAEFARAPVSQLIPIPSSLGFDEAACLPLSYAVAWHLLVGRARVGSNDTVLIMAAGSGLGVAGIQIAKLKGA